MQLLLRRTVGAIARVLVVLLALGTAVPFAAHGDSDHDPCDATPGGDLSRSRLHGPTAPVQAQHCSVCHWLRSLRVFDAVVVAPAAHAEVTREATAPRPATHARLLTPSVPTRGPPA